MAPFRKGGRAQRRGIFVRDCTNLMWFDLDSETDSWVLPYTRTDLVSSATASSLGITKINTR
jgi:hypothetical protein